MCSTGGCTVCSTGGCTVCSTGGCTVCSTGGCTVCSTGGCTVCSTAGVLCAAPAGVLCAAPAGVLYVHCVLCPLVDSFIFPCHTRVWLGCTCCKPVSDDARPSSLQVRVNYTSISKAFIIVEWNMTSEDSFEKDTPNLFMYTLRVWCNVAAHINGFLTVHLRYS